MTVDHQWYCTLLAAGPLCFSSRSTCLTLMAREGRAIDAATCPQQDTAICFEFRRVIEGRRGELCWSSIDFCIETRMAFASSSDYSAVGRCRRSSAPFGVPQFACSTVDGVSEISDCFRDAQSCNLEIAELARQGVSARCTPSPRAYCFAYRATSGIVEEFCAGSMAWCSKRAVSLPALVGCAEI